MNPSKRDRGEAGDAKIIFDDLVTKKVQVGGVHPNLEQEVILVTEDKVRLCLNDNFERAAKSKQWLAVLGMVASLVLTLTTENFQNFLWLSGQEWRGVVILALVLSVLWFVVSIRWAFGAPTIEDIVAELKAGSQKIATEDRLLSLRDEEVVLLHRNSLRSLVESSQFEVQESWGNPLRSPIPEETRKVLIHAMQAFRTALANVPNGGDAFLTRRGIGNSARESLRLGYAPDEWEFVLKKLQGIAPVGEIASAGLATRRKSKEAYYDRFRNRLMVPVEIREAMCGFIGVSIDGTDPFLLFSPESSFFARSAAVEYARSVPELRVITGL